MQNIDHKRQIQPDQIKRKYHSQSQTTDKSIVSKRPKQASSFDSLEQYLINNNNLTDEILDLIRIQKNDTVTIIAQKKHIANIALDICVQNNNLKDKLKIYILIKCCGADIGRYKSLQHDLFNLLLAMKYSGIKLPNSIKHEILCNMMPHEELRCDFLRLFYKAAENERCALIKEYFTFYELNAPFKLNDIFNTVDQYLSFEGYNKASSIVIQQNLIELIDNSKSEFLKNDKKAINFIKEIRGFENSNSLGI